MSEVRALFRNQAKVYASSRPEYPPELYQWLSDLSPGHTLAIDCATGNGQAAKALAKHYERVVALDVSQEQLELAPKIENVSYVHGSAEELMARDGSVDLVTVATGIHWFELEAFYAQVKRVLKPGGLLAAWCYGAHDVEDATIMEITTRYTRELVGPYWQRANLQLMRSGYQELPFPFDESGIEPRPWKIERAMTLTQYLGYLRSWSASERFAQERGQDPCELIRQELSEAWAQRSDEDGLVEVTWPLFMRVGRV